MDPRHEFNPKRLNFFVQTGQQQRMAEAVRSLRSAESQLATAATEPERAAAESALKAAKDRIALIRSDLAPAADVRPLPWVPKQRVPA
jgi:hypothetical protein